MTQAENISNQLEEMVKKYAEYADDEDFGYSQGLWAEFLDFGNANIWRSNDADRYVPDGVTEDDYDDWTDCCEYVNRLYVYADGSGLEGPFVRDTNYIVLSADQVIVRKKELAEEYAAELAEPLLAQSAALGNRQ